LNPFYFNIQKLLQKVVKRRIYLFKLHKKEEHWVKQGFKNALFDTF